MALLGESLSAADAERFGLVARVVPADALAAEARSVAVRLAALAPRALALTKRALERTWSIDLDTALDDEAWRQGIAGASADHARGPGGVPREAAASVHRGVVGAATRGRPCDALDRLRAGPLSDAVGHRVYAGPTLRSSRHRRLRHDRPARPRTHPRPPRADAPGVQRRPAPRRAVRPVRGARHGRREGRSDRLDARRVPDRGPAVRRDARQQRADGRPPRARMADARRRRCAGSWRSRPRSRTRSATPSCSTGSPRTSASRARRCSTTCSPARRSSTTSSTTRRWDGPTSG